ncbi:MAG: hypothetical protein B7Z80_13200 [Rhodospirillales bacterium 20-64-7]|nr:MAG: hypothetical protein B7Z80_13200 [Rhodospirillales bacterium 20-64-7]HQT77775.1 tetratricopeptide repeat protein [Rhodopila sp.]
MDIGIETAVERGRAAFAQGDHAAAEGHFQNALAAGHDDAELHHHMGYLARERGDFDLAATHYVAALRHTPSDPHLLNNLGEARRAQGLLAEAVALFGRARTLLPDVASVAINLGAALLALGRPDLALPHLEHAVALEPGHPGALAEQAACLCSLNRYQDAVAVYRQTYRLHPAANEARYLEALALLALGDFENGWRKHEVRWYSRLGEEQRRVAPGPYWLGDDALTGRTILVHAEQGYGDTIQFLRYRPLLQQRAGRVILEVPPLLKPLLAGTEDVFARGETLPAYDTHCSFMSLPRAFRTKLTTVPASVPYLTVPPDRLAAWRARLGSGDGRRRVAVAWTGTSAIWNRSIPLRLLAPLFARPDCEFHVVQTNMEVGDHDFLRGIPHVIDHSAALADFADSAAIVALMDQVITVDTALAHVGGALARPTWIMLPFGADYRWLTNGSTTAWYPTVRLFRQPALRAWPQVLTAIDHALSA